MPPRTLGPSRTVPGAVDVQLDDGSVVPVHPAYAPLPERSAFAAGFAPQQPQGLPEGAFAQTRGAPVDPGAAGVLSPEQTPQGPAVPQFTQVPAGDPLNSPQAAEALAQGLLYDAPAPQGAVAQPLTGPAQGFPGVTDPSGAPVFARPQQPAQAAPGGPQAPNMAGPQSDLDVARRALYASLQPRPSGPHMRTDVQITEQRGGPVSPETAQRAADTQRAADEAARHAFQTQAAGLEGLAGEEQATQRHIAAMAQQAEQQAAADAADLQGRLSRLDDERARIASFDPATAKVWGRPDTPSRLGAAVGVFLGGFAAGPGNPNQALQYIQHAIDRDVDIQRVQLESRHRSLDQGQNALMIARQIFSDRRAADAAAHAMMLEAASARVRAQLAHAQSQEVIANGEAILAQLEAQRAAAQAAAEAAQVQFLRRRRLVPGGPGLPSREHLLAVARQATAIGTENRQQQEATGAGAGLSAEQARALDRADRSVPPQGTHIIPGQEGQFRTATPETRARVTSQIGTYRTMDSILSDLERLRQEHGPTIDREAIGRITADIEAIIPLINTEQAGGVLQKHDLDRLHALVLDPSSFSVWSDDRFYSQIGQLRRIFRAHANDQLSAQLGLRLDETMDETRRRVRRGE